MDDVTSTVIQEVGGERLVNTSKEIETITDRIIGRDQSSVLKYKILNINILLAILCIFSIIFRSWSLLIIIFVIILAKRFLNSKELNGLRLEFSAMLSSRPNNMKEYARAFDSIYGDIHLYNFIKLVPYVVKKF